jgi:ribonuclease BN (tRNA processing enzyme)
MKLKILGCSGGIGGDMRTTSLLIDDDILIDAGTGVGDLSLDELTRINHIFITHSHLDHVACIPLLVDTVGSLRDKPISVHATPATLDILKEHLFNWKIWPDFTRIPNLQTPFMRYETLAVGRTVTIGGRMITPVPANHVVPTVGFHMDSGKASLVFSGDTTTNDALWDVVNKIENLKYLIIETAFCNRDKDIAIASKHLCPSMLADELKKMTRQAEIYITHLKPGEAEQTMQEIYQSVASYQPKMLENHLELEF